MPEQSNSLLKFSLHLPEKFRQALESADPVIAEHMEHASILATAELEAVIKDLILTPYGAKPPAVAYGTLAGAIFGEAHPAPLYGGTVAVHPPADVYAAPVETGTRPHFPPVNALLLWVKKKFGVKDEEAKGVAFAIARKIAARGTKGHHAFERGIQAEQPRITKIFQIDLDAAMAEIEGNAQ